MAIPFTTILAYAVGFPEAWKDTPWNDGEPVVKVGKKIFAFLNPDVGGCPTVTVKLTPELCELWLSRPHTFAPAYVGRFGWMGIRILDQDDWSTAQEGMAVSYQLIAPRKLARQLAPRL